MKRLVWAFAGHWSHVWRGGPIVISSFTTHTWGVESRNSWNKSSRLRVPQCWRFAHMRWGLCASARSGKQLMENQLPINDPG